MNQRPPLRADARRNRDQILRAAHAAFLEHGPDVPLDRIAERAGVGNATLYRHFPTRADLATRVVEESMARVRAAAEEALAAESDPWAALCRFAADVVRGRLVAMLPVLGPHVDDGAEFRAARARTLDGLGRLVDAARTDGPLRGDVGPGELILFLTLLSRPLPVLSDELDHNTRERMLHTLLDGLRSPDPTPLPGTAIGPARISEDLLDHGRNG